MSQSHRHSVDQYLPNGFQPHVFERTFRIARPRSLVWQLLNDPSTFTRGQLFPFRVEFFFEELAGGETHVRLRVSCYVRRWVAAPWTGMQAVFWSQFGWNIRMVLAWRGLFK
jgi:hypothetical protein